VGFGAGAIATARLHLVILDAPILAAMHDGTEAPASAPFTWPAWWPDEVDTPHVAMWRRRDADFDGADAWRPRAVVDRASATMIGHAGFHRPPQSLERALADSTYHGRAEPAAGGVVEIGYTIFPAARGQGYATETVVALVDWAFTNGAVSTVLAAVAEDNAASLAVLDSVGGFDRIGTCRDDDGNLDVVLRRDLVFIP
jgi:[ribosomal protein S5]-alanine N-acetyltransferase